MENKLRTLARLAQDDLDRISTPKYSNFFVYPSMCSTRTDPKQQAPASESGFSVPHHFHSNQQLLPPGETHFESVSKFI